MSMATADNRTRELRHGRNNEFLDLRAIARALGGEVVGGQVLCHQTLGAARRADWSRRCLKPQLRRKRDKCETAASCRHNGERKAKT
jgi:hypothetical protein